MQLEDYNILANLINVTWGEGSTNKSKNPSMSVVCKLVGDGQMEILHTQIFNFGEPHERKRNLDKIKKESISLINSTLSSLKKDFKDQSRKTLKTKVLSDNDTFELLSIGQFSGRRSAYYKRKVFLSIE